MAAKTIPALELPRTEARLLRWMLALSGVGTLAALAGGRGRVGVGFALGAALAILNYYWLQQAVVALLSAGESRLPKSVMAKFLVRYPLLFAGVWLFYKTGWLPFTGVLAGLFVPIAGALIECLVQLSAGFRQPSTTDH